MSVRAPDALRRSTEALQEAMGTIRGMAERVRHTVSAMAEPPSKVSVAFGIRFDAEAGVVVAKASTQAALKIELDWDAATSR